MRAISRLTKINNKLVKNTLLAFVVLSIVLGVLLMRTAGRANAATSFCYGQPETITATVPSSVRPGQQITVTNVKGIANSSIATVKSSTITFSISNATPISINETWSGSPMHGMYAVNYPDFTILTTGSAGSQITITISSIVAQVTINGVNTTISCTTSNGQLTASQPGQSLQLASITIAPSASGTGQNSQSTTSQSSTSQNNSKFNGAPGTIAAPVSTVVITVTNFDGKAVQGASVVLDSQSAVQTAKNGKVTFNNVTNNKHNLSVTAKGRTKTQVLDTSTNKAGQIMNVQVRLPRPSFVPLILWGVVGAFMLGAIAFITFWLKKRKVKKPLASPLTAKTPVPPTAPIPTNQLTTPQIISPTTNQGNTVNPMPNDVSHTIDQH